MIADRRAALLVFALVLAACGDDDAPHATEAPAPPPPPPPAPIAASRPVADAAAFALVPTGEGALLLWGAPFGAGGGVRALPLGPLGEALGSEQTVASRGAAAGGAIEERVSQAVELDAAAVGRRVGVAWVLDHGDAIETQSAFSLDGGHTFTTPRDLGPSERTPRGRKARLAMAAADDGTIVLYHRVADAPCANTAGSTCARITRSVVGNDRDERDGPQDEVPSPCEPFVGGALWRNGTWYHALCHASAAPTAMIYAIRPAISYAAAFDATEGCAPRGVAPLDEGVALITECGDRTSAVPLDDMGRERGALTPLASAVTCEGGRPLLRIGEGSHARTLRLGGAIDHLEGLLPETLAPRGARAIWTGEALLVAAYVGRDVSLRRYQCVRGDRFDRTDVR